MHLAALVLSLFTSTAVAQTSSGSTDDAVNSTDTAVDAPSNTTITVKGKFPVQPPFSPPQWYYNTRTTGASPKVTTVCEACSTRTALAASKACTGSTPTTSTTPTVWSTGYAFVNGHTTMERETRRWCALPVYRSGDREGIQRVYCSD